MNVDIIVDGRKVGTATIHVDVPKAIQSRHGVTTESVLKAATEGAESPTWYCMGAVQLIRQA